tara:strand:- start:9 stop:308 length:300 start_codon:yes stop_codon:yes gene_type:complete
MPEETKPKLTFSKVARKAYLYKNENKREGSNDPDYKGKLFDLDLNELKSIANEDGIVESLFLSGWIEEDQNKTQRVGISTQKGVPAAGEPVAATAEAPF